MNSVLPIPFTGSPSWYMEAVESFWRTNNPSRHSLWEAWKSHNQSDDLSTSRPTCISPKYTPLSPLWTHKFPSRSHEDFRKSALPFLLAGYKRKVEMFFAAALFVRNATVTRRNIFIVYGHGSPVFYSQRSVLISSASFRRPPEINSSFWSVIVSPSGLKRSRYQISHF